MISCKGIDLQAGITDSDELHADNKRTMLESAREKILVVDGSKFGKVAFNTIAGLGEITSVVTDEKPDEQWLQAMEAAGTECIYPE